MQPQILHGVLKFIPQGGHVIVEERRSKEQKDYIPSYIAPLSMTSPPPYIQHIPHAPVIRKSVTMEDLHAPMMKYIPHLRTEKEQSTQQYDSIVPIPTFSVKNSDQNQSSRLRNRGSAPEVNQSLYSNRGAPLQS